MFFVPPFNVGDLPALTKLIERGDAFHFATCRWMVSAQKLASAPAIASPPFASASFPWARFHLSVRRSPDSDAFAVFLFCESPDVHVNARFRVALENANGLPNLSYQQSAYFRRPSANCGRKTFAEPAIIFPEENGFLTHGRWFFFTCQVKFHPVEPQADRLIPTISDFAKSERTKEREKVRA